MIQTGLEDLELLELFRVELETHSSNLSSGLLSLEKNPDQTDQMEDLMRAAHSLKGAARIVQLDSAVRIAHAMEDCFVAVQRGSSPLGRERIDHLFAALDLLQRVSAPGADASGIERDVAQMVEMLSRPAAPNEERLPDAATASKPACAAEQPTVGPTLSKVPAPEVLRLSAENLNSLVALGGETVVAGAWLSRFAAEFLALRRAHKQSARCIERLHDLAGTSQDLRTGLRERMQKEIEQARQSASAFENLLVERHAELDEFDRGFSRVAGNLYRHVLNCRMRPFGDGVRGLPRMVREVARSLDKQVNLEVRGETTPVDRNVLQKIEAPLNHILRNAVDHGIESPSERLHAGKTEPGLIRLEARHHAGMLLVTITDDGKGIDIEGIRRAVIERNLAPPDVAAGLISAELLDFLFLPGFSMKQQVTEISGRGVGLDVVQTEIRAVGGEVRIDTQRGRGTQFHLRLPVTVSVIRTLIAEVDGHPYAFPLARVSRAVQISPEQIECTEGRQYFRFEGQAIGLVAATQVLELGAAISTSKLLTVIIVANENVRYGLVVDKLLGECELVIRDLDPRLGRIQNVSAAALLPDRTPVLILDIEDLLCTIQKLNTDGGLKRVEASAEAATVHRRKRVLIVEDSLTVRELERKLLDGHGYRVDTAVDGLDGWNAVRTGDYDLVITDIDMPRLDGIELIGLIRKHPKLTSLPVIVVSYKDREEDRRRGLEAGADHYLTKGAFHDHSMLRAVADLIGDVK